MEHQLRANGLIPWWRDPAMWGWIALTEVRGDHRCEMGLGRGKNPNMGSDASYNQWLDATAKSAAPDEQLQSMFCQI